MVSIVEGIKFVIAYFLFLLIWVTVYPMFGVEHTIIESVLVFMGFTGAMLYVVVTNRPTDFSFARFIVFIIGFMVYKFLMQNVVLSMVPNPTAPIYNIPLSVIDLLLIVTSVIWASGVLEERQKIETEVVEIPM